MTVKDFDILSIVEQIAAHYETITSNSFVRYEILKIELPYTYRIQMESLIDYGDHKSAAGYSLHELYGGVIGLAQFVYRTRTEVLPTLKQKINTSDMNTRLMEEMAADNLKSNISVLTDAINDLYVKCVNLDKDSCKKTRKKPLYMKTPDLETIGPLLTSDAPGLIH